MLNKQHKKHTKAGASRRASESNEGIAGSTPQVGMNFEIEFLHPVSQSLNLPLEKLLSHASSRMFAIIDSLRNLPVIKTRSIIITYCLFIV